MYECMTRHSGRSMLLLLVLLLKMLMWDAVKHVGAERSLAPAVLLLTGAVDAWHAKFTIIKHHSLSMNDARIL